MIKRIKLISIMGLIMAAKSFALNPQQHSELVVKGFKEEGITVKCSILATRDLPGYDYHVTHVRGFSSEEDFNTACMGTIVVNSALADFSTNWLYMTYGSLTYRIEVVTCQKFWLAFEKPNLSQSEMLNLVDKMLAARERVK